MSSIQHDTHLYFWASSYLYMVMSVLPAEIPSLFILGRTSMSVVYQCHCNNRIINVLHLTQLSVIFMGSDKRVLHNVINVLEEPPSSDSCKILVTS
jgi:hypothetical protein